MFSLTARTSLRAAARPTALRAAPPAVRFVGGHGSTTHDNDPEVLAREKEKNLQGHAHATGIHNAPGWNDRLASASEAAVKADRADVDPQTLQQHTVDAVKERHAADGAFVHSETTTTVSADGTTTTHTTEDVLQSGRSER